MLKNINKSKLLFVQVILLIVFTVIISIFAIFLHNEYKKEIIRNYAIVIGNVSQQYPELEADVMQELISNMNNYNEGIEILKKYGIEVSNLDELRGIDLLKNRYIIMNITVIVVMSITYIGISIYFYKKEDKRLKDISNYINSILNNDYSIDIREYNEDEISALKNYIYKITIKLRNMSENSQKEKEYLETALSDISHQLKTPLTSLMVINELLENENIDDSKRKECQEKSKIQLEKIQWLITSLLKISQIDSGTIKFKKEQLNLKEMLDKVIEPLAIQIELKDIILIENIDEDIMLLCDENWTIEAIVNIIKNAYEHTENSGTIKISAEKNPIYTEIKIEDNGCGISEEDINHIFERFYKGKSNKDSIGIGLNMSKMIIDKQNGSIEVKSKLGEGTTFCIKFYDQKL